MGAEETNAKDLNAGFVMNDMNVDQRTGYLSGVIEGLAYARWLKDQPNADGMNCIYEWYYGGDLDRKREVHGWLRRHPDKPVGPLLYVLAKEECGA